jgi:hypothetical protein
MGWMAIFPRPNLIPADPGKQPRRARKGSNAGDQGFFPLLALGLAEGENLVASLLQVIPSLLFPPLVAISVPDLLLRSLLLLSCSGNFWGELLSLSPRPRPC